VSFDLLLLRGQRIPRRDFLWPRRQLRTRWDDAHFELALISLFAILVPALIELAFELINPGLRNVVRRMGRARSELDEEWTVRSC